MLGPRPHEISFAAHCFEQVGEAVEFIVSVRTGAVYPKHFSERPVAEAYARRVRGTVKERRVPVLRRVSWT